MLEAAKKRLKAYVPDRTQWTKVDEALYGVDDLFRVEKAKAQKLSLEALKYSFRYHFEHNDFYRRFCQGEHVTPDLIKDYSDLVRIPLITDTFFKDYPTGSDFLRWLQRITSVTVPQIELNGAGTSFDAIIAALQEKKFTVTFSSGTSGKFSFHPRDALSWQRQQYCYSSAVAEMLGSFYDPGLAIMYLGPNPEKTNLFLGKVTEYYGVLFDKENITHLLDARVTTESIRMGNGRTKGLREWIQGKLVTRARQNMVSAFAEKLEGYAAQKRKVFILGPPSALNVVLSKLQDKKKEVYLGNNGFIMSAGGRRVRANAPMSEKEFRELIKERLGIPDENCSDFYGMSECSCAFAGCEGHYKHIPHSVLYPLVLDEDLKPLGYGKYGRFAFLDPVPISYPGFIITGNRVRILESCPSCDREGPVIEPDVSRMGKEEGGGCGRILHELIAGKI
jgi:hypothetical protein